MNFKNIPVEMQALKQWACYRTYTANDGKKKKVIISPVDGKFAKSNEPATWADFETAKKYCLRYRYHGLTFALTSGITFIDIDHAINKDTGEILSEEARKLLAELPDTFTERSVSGTGIHILVKGSLPKDALKRNDDKGLEMYDTTRFICMTGELMTGTTELKDCTQTIADINYAYIGKKKVYEPIYTQSTKSDSDLVRLIENSRQGEKFRRLYGGDTSGYQSHSNADFALCSILAWWTNDFSQIDRIFRNSGLYRDKWDSSRGSLTYGAKLIQDAMSVQPPKVFKYSMGGAQM